MNKIVFAPRPMAWYFCAHCCSFPYHERNFITSLLRVFVGGRAGIYGGCHSSLSQGCGKIIRLGTRSYNIVKSRTYICKISNLNIKSKIMKHFSSIAALLCGALLLASPVKSQEASPPTHGSRWGAGHWEPKPSIEPSAANR